MRGRFFGYEQIDPCPACGTPRVLADWDDDCYVIPGLLQPKVPATCNVVFEYRGGRWTSWAVLGDFENPLVCPECGGKLVEKEERYTFTDRWGRSVKMTGLFRRCENAIEQPAWVDPLEGCPQCYSSFSNWWGMSD